MTIWSNILVPIASMLITVFATVYTVSKRVENENKEKHKPYLTLKDIEHINKIDEYKYYLTIDGQNTKSNTNSAPKPDSGISIIPKIVVIKFIKIVIIDAFFQLSFAKYFTKNNSAINPKIITLRLNIPCVIYSEGQITSAYAGIAINIHIKKNIIVFFMFMFYKFLSMLLKIIGYKRVIKSPVINIARNTIFVGSSFIIMYPTIFFSPATMKMLPIIPIVIRFLMVVLCGSNGKNLRHKNAPLSNPKRYPYITTVEYIDLAGLTNNSPET